MKKRGCINCGRNSKYRLAWGLCHTCYMRLIYNPKHREQISQRKKEYGKTWYVKNKEKRAQYHKNRYIKGITNTVKIKRDRHGTFYYYYSSGKAVHRVIAEYVLGRKLKYSEVIHHLDGNGLNNSHDNLIICSRSYHQYLHKNGKLL